MQAIRAPVRDKIYKRPLENELDKYSSFDFWPSQHSLQAWPAVHTAVAIFNADFKCISVFGRTCLKLFSMLAILLPKLSTVCVCVLGIMAAR